MIDLISVGLSGQELVDKVNEVIAAINDMANVSSFSQLSGKPTINGVTVNGNLSLTDLGMTMEHIPGYDDLTAAMLTSDDVETITLDAVDAAETAVSADLAGKMDKDIDGLDTLQPGYIEGGEMLLVSKGGALRKVDVDTLTQVALQRMRADENMKGINIQVNPSQQQSNGCNGGGDGGGGGDTPTPEKGGLFVTFSAKTVPTCRAANGYYGAYERVVELMADKGIDELLTAVGEGKMLAAATEDLDVLCVSGYLDGDRFYRDENLTNEIVCDEEHIYVTRTPVFALTTGATEEGGYYSDGLFYEDYEYHIPMTGVEGRLYRDYNGYPRYDDCVYKCTRYLRWTKPRFVEISYDDGIYGYPVWEGYYNEADGLFYRDASHTTPQECTSYGETYRDLASGKTYMWDMGGFVACSIEDFLLEKGRMQITNVMTKANYVRFQLLDNNDELTFTGRRVENLGEMIDLWSMNVNRNKYEEKANKIQSIGKGSADLYPSEAAVIAYVQSVI